MHCCSQTNFLKFLESLKDKYDLYAPVKKGQQLYFQRHDQDIKATFDQVRTVEPLKSFFYPAREIVAQGFKPDVEKPSNKPICVVGVKACDLKGFKVQDHVFKNHDFADPFYNNKRQEMLIISVDCTCVLDTCFCLAVDVKPYPTEDFDINVSFVGEDVVVEAASNKGKQLIEQSDKLFDKAKDELIAGRDNQRKEISEAVQQNIEDNSVPHQDSFAGMIERNFESRIWADEAKTCVECGACNTICPTCHCFLLYDQKAEDKLTRMRIWDSCMIKDFAQVAGGANPRDKLWQRLRNRFEKKFDFFPKVADVYACTGCGRCITACPAKIDIRRVLKRLADNE